MVAALRLARSLPEAMDGKAAWEARQVQLALWELTIGSISPLDPIQVVQSEALLRW